MLILKGKNSYSQRRMAAGDFTASEIMDVVLKAEIDWTNGAQANQYKSHAEAAVAVLNHQTAKFVPFDDNKKDNTVKIVWINGCAVATQNCTETCTITAAELESDAKTYVMDLCQETSFKVDREKSRTNLYQPFEEVRAGFALGVKVLDEWWAKQTLIKIDTFADINAYPTPWTFDAANMTTDVPAAQYNLSMVADLLLQAEMNDMNAPYYIERGGLWVPTKNAQLNAGNGEGKGDNLRTEQLDITFDMRNFSKAGLTKDMFAIDAGAVALKTYARNSPEPEEIGGSVNEIWYSIPSNKLPGVTYDVVYQVQCAIANGVKTIFDVFQIKTRGGVFLNPTACPVTVDEVVYNPSGVLSYTKTA